MGSWLSINAGRPQSQHASSSSSSFSHTRQAQHRPQINAEHKFRAKTKQGNLTSSRRSGQRAMARWWQLAAVLVVAVSMAATTSISMAQDALQTKCQDDLAKLSDCMDYATGHEDTPSAKCCDDTGETQKARPECLCYIIQQVHSGTHGVQNLGLRFDRLLAQPAACRLAHANVSLCINLLHLTPSSPDYAMFANASNITPSPAAPASDTAGGFKVPTGLGYGVVAAAVVSAVFSSIF